jgi:hypothetical protein
MISSQSPAPGKQVLGKRKHGQTMMRVPPQTPNIMGASSQVFSAEPTRAGFANFSTTPSFNIIQSTQTRPATSTPTSNRNSNIFVMNTITSMEKGDRPTLKRTSTRTRRSPQDSPESPAAAKKGPGPTRLRPSKPLRNASEVYEDVWINILGFCQPKFLIEAKTINSHLYKILKENQAIWRQSRLLYYGNEMPNCPRNLTEKQYAELVAGRGCQNRECPKSATHKVHWAFQGRLCPECAEKLTMTVDDLSAQRQHALYGADYTISGGAQLMLWELLPLGRMDG